MKKQIHNGPNVTEITLAEVLADPALFFGFLKIVDKKGRVIPLRLNIEQEQMLKLYTNRGDKNIVILKPRQIGSSTFFAALLFWKWYVSIDPVKIISMSHTHDSAQNFNKMHRTFWENLPDFMKVRTLSKSNTQVLELEDTGASIECRTAGGKGGIRSFSCNILHISEYAFCSDPEELLATAIPALNDGLLIIESTPNYFGDALHKIINESKSEDSNWIFHFFSWKDHWQYRIPRVTIQMTEEEAEYSKLHNLNGLQMAWRRKKISEMGISKFKRDYPLTLEDAYSLSGDAWMIEEELKHLHIINIHNGIEDQITLEAPAPREKYAIGVDVASGVGKDYSVIYVLSCKTRSPVYCFRSNTIKPSDLAHKIQDISTRYNGAKVLSERNSIGEVIYSEFKHIGFHNYWRDDRGEPWLTTAKNKPVIIQNLRKVISSGTQKIIDGWAIDQLRSIRVNNKGDPNFDSRDNFNGHYDNIMALALAHTCADSIPHFDQKSGYKNALEVSIAREKEAARISAYRGVR